MIRLRVLHLTSDWKWTGQAAPLLALLRAQRARGLCAELACPRPPADAGPGLFDRAAAAGVEPVLTLTPARGARWWRDRRDLAGLRALLLQRAFDVLHVWHTRDHVLALRAGATQRRAGSLRVVRSYPRAERIAARPWNRVLFGPGTDGLLCVSPGAARQNARRASGGRVLGAFGAVDLDVFHAGPAGPEVRAGLGLGADDLVVGIAARVQRQRRFDLLLSAFAELARELPRARLLVLGRGTHIDRVAVRPARALGLADRVVFAGYRGRDYPDALRAIDVFSLLVPGSDGGCRALLEAAACGLPAVVTKRGALPEIVRDGETGIVVAEEPAALAGAWRALLEDPHCRARLGRAARRRAEAAFSPHRYAEAVEALYRPAGRAGAPPPSGRESTSWR